ncbi:right-handed parallel beta-helix repeat-containing protein [Candidatus Woesearchaeota archaeon]|nr:right-handed parallel beta-helix repeat-containing protein [Candidatus Woesearchaeota archaeon]
MFAVVCGDTVIASEILTSDISQVGSGSCLTIGANDASIDCNGYSISGDGTGGGIFVSAYDRVVIQNCIIKNFETGIALQTTKDNLVANNSFELNRWGLAFALGANFTNVTNNTFSGSLTSDLAFSVGTTNNSVWMNRFYGKGITGGTVKLNQSFCIDERGNFYRIGLSNPIGGTINWNKMGWNDCGHPKIIGTFPNFVSGNFLEDPFQVNWTNQSSYPDNMSFYLEYWNGSLPERWWPINFTEGNSSVFDTDALWNLCSYRLRVIPWDTIANGTPNITAQFCIKTRGTINVNVQKCPSDGIGGFWKANVWLFNTSFVLQSVNLTDGAGNFGFTDMPHTNYTIVVNYTGYTNARRNISLRADTTEIVNFLPGEVCPLTSDCQEDCTRIGGDVCDSSCDGINGCTFQFGLPPGQSCEGSRLGLRILYNTSHDAICCDYRRFIQKTPGIGINIPGKNVVKLTSIINFRDAFKYIVGAKMHVIVFKKEQ